MRILHQMYSTTFLTVIQQFCTWEKLSYNEKFISLDDDVHKKRDNFENCVKFEVFISWSRSRSYILIALYDRYDRDASFSVSPLLCYTIFKLAIFVYFKHDLQSSHCTARLTHNDSCYIFKVKRIHSSINCCFIYRNGGILWCGWIRNLQF